jgi:hypothetical protein
MVLSDGFSLFGVSFARATELNDNKLTAVTTDSKDLKSGVVVFILVFHCVY